VVSLPSAIGAPLAASIINHSVIPSQAQLLIRKQTKEITRAKKANIRRFKNNDNH
jgi:hypothetical protein